MAIPTTSVSQAAELCGTEHVKGFVEDNVPKCVWDLGH